MQDLLDDSDLVSDLLRDLLGDELSELGVDLLSLEGGKEGVAPRVSQADH